MSLKNGEREMANFATLEDVENILQREITEADEIASVEFALTVATAVIRNYTKQYIEFVAAETITLDCRGGSRVYLPELPVSSVTQVTENGVILTADEDYKLGQYGILHRIDQDWEVGIQILEIIYPHGFDPIPDDIIGVCARAASRVFQAGLRAAEDEGVPGVSSKSLGDYAVSYGGEGGSSGEGVMGVSSARMLLLSEKDVLDHYRIKGP